MADSSTGRDSPRSGELGNGRSASAQELRADVRPLRVESRRGAKLRRFVVYALIDPRDGQAHYVGRTAEGSRRPFAHWSPSLRGMNSGRVKQAWIEDLRASGRGPYEIRILETAETFAEVVAAETKWIAKGKASGWPLTNVRGGTSGQSPLVERERKRREKEAHRAATAHLARLCHQCRRLGFFCECSEAEASR